MPIVSSNRLGYLRATRGPPDTTTTVGVTQEKPKRKRATTEARKAVKGKKRVAKKAREDAPNNQPELQDTPSDQFKQQYDKGPEHYWVLEREEPGEAVLEKALHHSRKAKAYLAIMNDDTHLSVIHSLIQLEQELRPLRPVLGKIAGFVGDNRPSSCTPSNVVVFDDKSTLFTGNSYPMVRFAEVTEHYRQQNEYLPVASKMTGASHSTKGQRMV